LHKYETDKELLLLFAYQGSTSAEVIPTQAPFFFFQVYFLLPINVALKVSSLPAEHATLDVSFHHQPPLASQQRRASTVLPAMAEAGYLPAPMNPPRSVTGTRRASRESSHNTSTTPRFHDQIGSAQYRKEIDAISFAINPSSSHEGDADNTTDFAVVVDPSEPKRLCYRFEEDLRLADYVDLHDVTAWVRECVGCRLCIARVRNAVRIHAAYKWYEVRQRVNVAIKMAAVSEGSRLASPPWQEESVDKLSAWMREGAAISEVMSS